MQLNMFPTVTVSWSLQESGKLQVIACELLLPAFLFSKCRVPVVEFILIQTSIKNTSFSFNAESNQREKKLFKIKGISEQVKLK